MQPDDVGEECLRHELCRIRVSKLDEVAVLTETIDHCEDHGLAPDSRQGLHKVQTEIVLEATAKQTTKNKKIKPQETRGFNVENPSNAKVKNHGRQPAKHHYIGCVFTTHSSGLQEE